MTNYVIVAVVVWAAAWVFLLHHGRAVSSGERYLALLFGAMAVLCGVAAGYFLRLGFDVSP